jgi:hypothetical protein
VCIYFCQGGNFGRGEDNWKADQAEAFQYRSKIMMGGYKAVHIVKHRNAEEQSWRFFVLGGQVELIGDRLVINLIYSQP